MVEEPVFLRERFTGLDEFNEVALFGVGQFVAVGVGGAGHG